MPLQTGVLSRSERRKARTTAAILDAAERHFLERGFAEARVDEIADDADVAVGSLYNHFGSKEGLYRALMERALELFELYLDEGAEPERPALEQLLDTAGRVARFGREQPGGMRMLALPQPGRPDDELAEVLARVRRAMADRERRTAALIEAAMRRGQVSPLDARDAAAFLWAAWKGMLTLGRHAERSRPGDDAELRGVIEAGLRIALGGLASGAARDSDAVVRAILESAPAPATSAPTGSRPRLAKAPAAADLRAELPDLALWTTEMEAHPNGSPEPLRRRLAELGERFTAARASGSHAGSTPWGYRVLFRQLGLDPEEPRDRVQEAALQRVGAGDFESRGLLEDALLIAVLETGVPVVALDSARLNGEPALRRAADGERLGEGGDPLPAGRIVIADLRRPLAVLFGEVAPELALSPSSERVTLAAIQVKGVPDLGVEEALWTVREICAS